MRKTYNFKAKKNTIQKNAPTTNDNENTTRNLVKFATKTFMTVQPKINEMPPSSIKKNHNNLFQMPPKSREIMKENNVNKSNVYV